MKYTSSFTVTDTGVTIRRATANEAAGDGVIPAGFNTHKIRLIPVRTGEAYQQYYVKGTHPDAEWALVRADDFPAIDDDGLANFQTILYVKAKDNETFTMALFATGR